MKSKNKVLPVTNKNEMYQVSRIGMRRGSWESRKKKIAQALKVEPNIYLIVI